jgi:hypothetical protein
VAAAVGLEVFEGVGQLLHQGDAEKIVRRAAELDRGHGAGPADLHIG